MDTDDRRLRVRVVFSADDAHTVLSISLSSHARDRLIWHYEKRGSYTVKSGYILASHLNRPPEVLPHVDWTLREFLWRALRGVRPTKDRLAQRGMNYGTLCGCGADPETLEQVSTRCLGPGLVFSDAQEVVQAVSSDVEDWSEYGNIIEDCRRLLRQRVDIKVSWIRRVANDLAHCLARNSRFTSSFMFWTSPPLCIMDSFR
ncbi:hypothetical protein K2173_020906 [Erythroxylum novogranatense]|uniref:RNase H type-1 domain-containing protein n=1 Tax=Erythroxylum novogranatense TaxID=1862640 RepID=A0AAV8TM29_9ROSI|nr:hypothetical protein K2173_020906 [Erythroxylum novogranatense]